MKTSLQSLITCYTRNPSNPLTNEEHILWKEYTNKLLKDYNKIKITVEPTVGAIAVQLQPYRLVSY